MTSEIMQSSRQRDRGRPMKTMFFRIAVFGAFLLCQAALAGPLELSPDQQGDALIVPVWTAASGNDTLITVRNNSEWAVAVKVRVIDRYGREFAVFNLYLNDDDAWTGALTASGNGSVLLTSDGSCRLTAEEPPSDVVILPPPGPRFGYLEIVEMARLPQDGSLGASLITRWPDCDALAERFETGEWATDPAAGLVPPARSRGRISAGVQIIDVAEGGMISVPATALEGFSDIVQHTPPESPVPNLSTAHGADTDSGLTESRVCAGAECRILGWAQPVEAVASVLLTGSLRGDVVLNPAIGGLTELVVTRPLKRYEASEEEGFAIEAEPGFVLFDREGAFVESQTQSVLLSPPPPPKATPISIPGFEPWHSVGMVSFEPLGSDVGGFRSAILGMFLVGSFSTEGTGFVSGHARIGFRQSSAQQLTSLEGVSLRGEAAIGISVQQFTNGALEPDPATQVSVLSNYRTAETMTRR